MSSWVYSFYVFRQFFYVKIINLAFYLINILYEDKKNLFTSIFFNFSQQNMYIKNVIVLVLTVGFIQISQQR